MSIMPSSACDATRLARQRAERFEPVVAETSVPDDKQINDAATRSRFDLTISDRT